MRAVFWDGHSLGKWVEEINGAFAVINLSGRSIKCLFTKNNINTLKNSRVQSTKVIGQAIAQAKHPPALWIQISSVAVYSHSLCEPHDEQSTRLGEKGRPVPFAWKQIAQLVQSWEEALYLTPTPRTRKILARLSVVMGEGSGSAFDIFCRLAKWGLGGSVAGGRQYVSWIHEQDFLQSIVFLMQNPHIKGVVNLTAPHPIAQRDFMAVLCLLLGRRLALPASKWMIKLSSYFTRVDPELILKSRYVVPKILIENNFQFQFPHWPPAARSLLSHPRP